MSFPSWWPVVGRSPWLGLRSLRAWSFARKLPASRGPARILWPLLRSFPKWPRTARRVCAWIAPAALRLPSDDGPHATDENACLITESKSFIRERTTRLYSNRSVDCERSFPQWLAGLAKTGSGPSAEDVKEAVANLQGEVPLHFPMDSCPTVISTTATQRVEWLHYIRAGNKASLDWLEKLYTRHGMETSGGQGSEQSVLVAHSFPDEPRRHFSSERNRRER